MNKKLRYSFKMVLGAAEKLECKDMHHMEKQKHKADYMCPVEYEIAKHADIVRRYMEENIK